MLLLTKPIKHNFSYFKQHHNFSNLPIPHLSRKPSSNNTKTSSQTPLCNPQITHNGRRGNIERAQFIFDNLPSQNVDSWTALLTAYADNGRICKAREVFDEMPERNTATWNAMVSAYVRTSNISEAYRLFSKTPHKNLVSYSAMISGFSKNGMMWEAERLFKEMPLELCDPVGSNSLLNGYLNIGDFDEAVGIFRRMSTRDVFTWSLMVDGYCKCAMIFEALEAFSAMPERNVVSWTSMIRGLMKVGNWEDGFQLFAQMRKDGVMVNSTTLSVIFDACAEMGRSEEGLQIHGLVLVLGFENDVFLGNSIIVMYSRVGWVDDARRWFNDMSRKDVVSWNSIINGYVENGEIGEAYALFEAMPGRDEVSWTSMLVGFSNQGLMTESVRLFEVMPKKDDVAWTAIISGFVSNGEDIAALKWFIRMMQEGLKRNPMAFCCVLSAVARLAILNQGLQIHALIIKLDLESDVSIQTSLVSMYAKCGDLSNAYCIFAAITEPNVVTLNAMITGFAQHGLAREALELFRRVEADGYLKPNHVTFLGILSACSHAGLVEEGYRYFENMSSCYGIEPGPDHYTCMVHLLGRVGLLDEAKGLIGSMPFRPNSSVWGALLDASRLHSNLSLAKLAAEKFFELDPSNAIAYTVLSNIYSETGMKEDEEEVRTVRRSKSVKKNPGYSWISTEHSIDQCVGA